MLIIYCTCTSFAEEEKKRKQESSFSAVGFSYGSVAPPSAPPQRKEEEEAEDPPLLACYPQQLEHPPSSSVDHRGDGQEEYVPPSGLIIPNNIKPVCNVCFFKTLYYKWWSSGHFTCTYSKLLLLTVLMPLVLDPVYTFTYIQFVCLFCSLPQA